VETYSVSFDGESRAGFLTMQLCSVNPIFWVKIRDERGQCIAIGLKLATAEIFRSLSNNWLWYNYCLFNSSFLILEKLVSFKIFAEFDSLLNMQLSVTNYTSSLDYTFDCSYIAV
jgi:hypothetical protein